MLQRKQSNVTVNLMDKPWSQTADNLNIMASRILRSNSNIDLDLNEVADSFKPNNNNLETIRETKRESYKDNLLEQDFV
jgi:hypothetical protein